MRMEKNRKTRHLTKENGEEPVHKTVKHTEKALRIQAIRQVI